MEFTCDKHHVQLKCMAGEPAHDDNWYCPECDKEDEAMTPDEKLREVLGKSMPPDLVGSICRKLKAANLAVVDLDTHVVSNVQRKYIAMWLHDAKQFCEMITNHSENPHVAHYQKRTIECLNDLREALLTTKEPLP